MPAEANEQRHDAEDDERALRQEEASPARDDRRSGGRAADAVGTQEENLHRLAAHPRGRDAVHRLAGQPLEPETGERLGDAEGPENDAPAEGVAERYDGVRQQRERQDRTESDEAPPDLLGTALVDEPGEQEDAGEGGKDGHRAPTAPRRPRAPLRRGPLGGRLRCTHGFPGSGTTRSETNDPLVRRAAPSLDLVVKRRVRCQLASAYSDEPLGLLEQRLQPLERARRVEAVLDSLVVGVSERECLAASDRAVV